MGPFMWGPVNSINEPLAQIAFCFMLKIGLLFTQIASRFRISIGTPDGAPLCGNHMYPLAQIASCLGLVSFSRKLPHALGGTSYDIYILHCSCLRLNLLR